MCRIVSTALALLALSIAFAEAAPPLQGDAYYRALQTAARVYDSRDMEAAAPLLQELVDAFPEDGRTWLFLANARYALKQFSEAATAYTHAVDLGAGQPWVVTYNLACCYALVGDRENAVQWLERSLALRWEDRPLLLNDADFTLLHDDPRWPELAGLLPPDREFTRDSGWRYDLDFFVSEVRRLHPDPFRVTPETEFVTLVTALGRQVSELSDAQITVEIQKLVALLGDGHSHVRLGGVHDHPRAAGNAGRPNAAVLPVQAYAFADGLFIVRARDGHDDLVGAEVLAMGSLETPVLRERVRALVAHDNPMQYLWMGPRYLIMPAVLENLGALEAGRGEDGSPVPIRVRDRDGTERTVLLVPDSGTAAADLPPVQLAGIESPRYLTGKEHFYWFEEIPGADAVYVQFNSVRDAADESLADFADRLRAWTDAHPVASLILDVRHNGGGDSHLYPPLVKTLMQFEASREDRRVYTILGRNTFSAAQNFVTDVDTWTRSVFAGEPSGSRPSFIGEGTTTTLPWSGLVVGISSRFHQQSEPGDERLWIAPRIPVALTAAAYFAGTDPALDAVLDVIGSQKP